MKDAHRSLLPCFREASAGDVCPSSFPSPIALGASFNSTLWKLMGSVIGVELRALWLVMSVDSANTCKIYNYRNAQVYHMAFVATGRSWREPR